MIKAEGVFKILEVTHQPTVLEQFSNYTPFQLLVMTLLSSRTKDATTIPLMLRLFKKHPAPQDFLHLPIVVLEKELYGIGFYRVKARNIQKLSKIVLEKYGGRIPDTLEGLTSLPGVGRKTANCILNYAFHGPAIAVDIHVHIIANRLGWINTKGPEETEFALQKVVPKSLWINVNRLFVYHGQSICLTQKPKCNLCSISKHCQYFKERFSDRFFALSL